MSRITKQTYQIRTLISKKLSHTFVIKKLTLVIRKSAMTFCVTRSMPSCETNTICLSRRSTSERSSSTPKWSSMKSALMLTLRITCTDVRWGVFSMDGEAYHTDGSKRGSIRKLLSMKRLKETKNLVSGTRKSRPLRCIWHNYRRR